MKHTRRRIPMTRTRPRKPLTREKLVELSGDQDLLFADGFDDALLGIATRCGKPTIVVYDLGLCIEVLMGKGLDHDEAMEYLDYNTIGAWVGDRTPAFLVRPDDED